MPFPSSNFLQYLSKSLSQCNWPSQKVVAYYLLANRRESTAGLLHYNYHIICAISSAEENKIKSFIVVPFNKARALLVNLQGKDQELDRYPGPEIELIMSSKVLRNACNWNRRDTHFSIIKILDGHERPIDCSTPLLENVPHTVCWPLGPPVQWRLNSWTCVQISNRWDNELN